MHAQLQEPDLILQQVKTLYMSARAKTQRFFDDGYNAQTTPNFLQFVEEMRAGKLYETVIHALKPAKDTLQH
jgi:hypothetical protein